MGMGVAALAWLAWPVALLAALTFGVGLGFTIPAGNLLVAESTSERAAGAVSLLNVAWGIGAVVWPPVVALAGPARVHVLLGVAAAVTVSGAAIAVIVARGWKQPAGPLEAGASAATATPGSATGFWGLLFFLYVGTETALAGWSATYAQSLSGASSPAWALTPAFVWAPLVIGRLVAPIVLRHASEEAVFRGGLLLALAGLVFLPYAGGRIAVVAAVSLGGLGLAPLFPILMASLARRFGRDAARIGGLMFALCGLGGATVPWLVGVVSSRAGSMRAGLSVLVMTTTLLLALHLATQRRAASDL
jgi:fucose permease